MPRFRLTVRKTEVSHEIIELDAYLDGQRRGVTTITPYDEDKKATELVEVVAVKEV